MVIRRPFNSHSQFPLKSHHQLPGGPLHDTDNSKLASTWYKTQQEDTAVLPTFKRRMWGENLFLNTNLSQRMKERHQQPDSASLTEWAAGVSWRPWSLLATPRHFLTPSRSLTAPTLSHRYPGLFTPCLPCSVSL